MATSTHTIAVDADTAPLVHKARLISRHLGALADDLAHSAAPEATPTDTEPDEPMRYRKISSTPIEAETGQLLGDIVSLRVDPGTPRPVVIAEHLLLFNGHVLLTDASEARTVLVRYSLAPTSSLDPSDADTCSAPESAPDENAETSQAPLATYMVATDEGTPSFHVVATHSRVVEGTFEFYDAEGNIVAAVPHGRVRFIKRLDTVQS